MTQPRKSVKQALQRQSFAWESAELTMVPSSTVRVDDPASVLLCDWPDEDIGIMLYDVFDLPARAAGFRWLRPEETASAAHGHGEPAAWRGEKAARRE